MTAVLLPRPREAWVDPRRPEAAGEALARGAHVVRTAVPEDDAAAQAELARLGFAPGPAWLIWEGVDAAALPPLPDAAARIPPGDPALRPRRLSAGQWHNARVRLAVQMALEAGLPRDASAASGPGRGPWGLAAVPDAVLPLVSFGPFDLMDAMARGEVVTAGDPARPRGVLLLAELRPGPLRPDRRLLLRWLSGTPEAAAALLGYASARARQLGGAALDASLPAALAQAVTAWTQGHAEPRRLVVYELTAPSS